MSVVSQERAEAAIARKVQSPLAPRPIANCCCCCCCVSGEAHLLHKEAKRLSQLPNIATVNFIPMVEGTRALMERLLPLEIEYLKAPHMERLRSDVVSALQTLHGCGIVHADIHRQNVMVRRDPPSLVLVDLGGTAGESIYPLSLGYGAIGEGGTRHRTPHEQGSPPVRTAKGDYFRLAMMLRHEILEAVHVKMHRHFKAELDRGLSLVAILCRHPVLSREAAGLTRPSTRRSSYRRAYGIEKGLCAGRRQPFLTRPISAATTMAPSSSSRPQAPPRRLQAAQRTPAAGNSQLCTPSSTSPVAYALEEHEFGPSSSKCSPT